jgi:hypothetical protein
LAQSHQHFDNLAQRDLFPKGSISQGRTSFKADAVALAHRSDR